MARHRIRNAPGMFTVVLLVAGLCSPAAIAGESGTADSADSTRPDPVAARKVPSWRRGPALEDSTGMVYVISNADIRRSGAATIPPVPGMDVTGRFEGSTGAR